MGEPSSCDRICICRCSLCLESRTRYRGAICGAIVDSFGFVSNTVQTENAIFGIRLTSSVIPAITFFVGVIALFFYPISKKLNEHIQDDLAKRRLENN